jgi:CubicO group peptidase (beta-lactamase class C family)
MNRMLAVLAFAATACAHQSTLPGAAPSRLTADLDTVVARFAALNGSPGLGVVVVRDTQTIYLKGVGYADAERRVPFGPGTEFYIASTTKSFTGLAAAILAQRGVWDLDAPVSRYLPQLRLKAPLDPDSITLRSLLTHTHGIASGVVDTRLAFTGEYDGNAELVRLLAEHSARPTGRAYAYSNLGYNIATLAMDAVTQKSWKDVLQDEIFTPLKMTHTTAYVSHVARQTIAVPYRATPGGFAVTHFGKTDANMQSAGGLLTTLGDMGTWLELHLNDGRIGGRQVVPAAAVRESHRLLTPAQGRGRPWQQVGYGLGWQISLRGSDTLFVHGGGFAGYATHMSFLPSASAGVSVMANNSEIGSGIVDLLAGAIYDVLQGKPPVTRDSMAVLASFIQKGREGMAAELARRAARPQTLPYPLAAYVGTYRSPALGTVRISEANGRLEARFGAAWSAVETYDATKNQLRVEPFGSGEVVTVTMENDRAATLTMGPLVFRRVP